MSNKLVTTCERLIIGLPLLAIVIAVLIMTACTPAPVRCLPDSAQYVSIGQTSDNVCLYRDTTTNEIVTLP